jgi:membrane protease YdiL (CAAX protease family)
MEQQSLITTPPPTKNSPSNVRFVFFNDRGLRAGWRIAIFGAILYAIYALGTFVVRRLGAGGRAGGPGATEPHYLLPIGLGIAELVAFLIILLVSWVMSRIERRRVGEYGLPLTRSAWSQLAIGYLLWGFLPLSLLLLIMRSLHVFYFGNLILRGSSILIWGLLWGFTFLMVGFFEEYTFRGYALYTLADGIGFWPAAIILAAVFGRVHMGNSGETHIGIIDVCLFAIFAAVTLRLTGNLWLAVGAHAGWDWGESFFYGVNDSGTTAPGHLFNSHVQGPDWLSGGSVGPEGSVLSSAFLILMTIAFFVIYRKRREGATVMDGERSPAPQGL